MAAGKGMTWHLGMQDGMSKAASAATAGVDKLSSGVDRLRAKMRQLDEGQLIRATQAANMLGRERVASSLARGRADNVFSMAQYRDRYTGSMVAARNPGLRPGQSSATSPIDFNFASSGVGQSLKKALQREFVNNPAVVSTIAKYGEHFPKIASMAAGAASAIASVSMAAAKLYAGFVALSGAAALAFGTMVRGAQKVREDAMFALGALLKSPGAAEAAYARAAALSVKLGKDYKESIGGFTELMARGFNEDGAEKAMRAAADLSVLSPNMDTSRIVTALAQIRSKGKLQMEELQGQIGEAFDVGAVIAQLSKQLGKTPDEVRKAITAGKVTGEQGIAAFYAAVEAKTGKSLGMLAEGKAGTTLEGLWARAKNLGQQLLATAKVDWKPMQGALQNLNNFLSSPAAEAGLNRIVKAFNGVLQAVFGDLAGADGPEKMETILNAVATGAEKMAESLKGAAGAASTILSLFQRLDEATDNKGTMAGVGSMFDAVTTGLLGLAMGPIAWFGGLLWDIGEGFIALGEKVPGLRSVLEAVFVTLPSAIGSALWSGLTVFAEWYTQLASTVVGWAADFFAWGANLGRSLIAGIIEAIRSLSPNIAAGLEKLGVISEKGSYIGSDADAEAEANAARSGYDAKFNPMGAVANGAGLGGSSGGAQAGAKANVTNNQQKTQTNHITINESKDAGSTLGGVLGALNQAA